MEHLVISTKILFYTIEECNENIKKLIECAKKISCCAYAPYSKFKVGAAVLLTNGQIVTGTNQENAAYPSGLCAERTALFYANTQYPDIPVEAIAIVGQSNNNFTDTICSPCGSCRQVLLEVEQRFNHPIRIIMCAANHIYEASSIQDLLPLSFGKENLE